ncbi:hypothetical protein ACFL48_04680 [Pseudomonadota bacterium]
MPEWVIPVVHLLGSLVGWVLISSVLAVASYKLNDSYENRVGEGLRLKMGLSQKEWLRGRNEQSPELQALLVERYSDDLLQNRIADFLGLIQMVLGWVFLVLMILAFGLVAWEMFTGSWSSAIYAWFILVAQVAWWLINECFTFMCRLLTGRNPGEPKRVRKGVDVIQENAQS